VKGSIGHGVYFSAAVHGGLLLALVFGLGAPRPLAEATPEAVEVEVVDAKEVPPRKEPEATPPPKPSSETAQTPAPSQPQAAQAAPSPQTQQTAAAQQPAPAAPQAAAPGAPQAEGQFSMFDVGGLAHYFNLRPPSGGFDSLAVQTAKLSDDDRSRFRADLRRCWQQPAGVSASSQARVVLRVSFTPEGALAGEPSLIEASASHDGPAVYKAAMQALAQCAPHRSLPPDRYSEWKVLDVSFSSREMSGG
jgi:hypothetical protein